MALLEVKDISVNFGGLKAVDKVSFDIERGEIVGLIGPNGAGKTTIFNLLTSVYQPNSGEVLLHGKSLLNTKTWDAVNLGIGRTFQNIRLYKQLSVLDNVRIGFHNQGRYGLFSSWFRLPSYWREEQRYERRAYDLLDLFGLKELAHVEARQLPYGQQRRLEIARALATSPQLLLLDEPAAGMNAVETADLLSTIRFIRDYFDLSVVLIEHDMNLVMEVCERIIVLNYGKVLTSGRPDEVRNNSEVITAYLGTDDEDEQEVS